MISCQQPAPNRSRLRPGGSGPQQPLPVLPRLGWVGHGHLAERLGLPAHELEQDIAAVLDRTLPLAVFPAVANHPHQS